MPLLPMQTPVDKSSGGGGSGESVRVVFVDCKAAKHVKNQLEADHMLRRDYRIAPSSSHGDGSSIVAIPVVQDHEYESTVLSTIEGVHGFGFSTCPFSSATLGNRNTWKNMNNDDRAINLVQAGLLLAVQAFLDENRAVHGADADTRMRLVQELSLEFCPSKLEVFGDDRTLVIPQIAFQDDATLKTLLGTEDGTSVASFKVNYLWGNLAKVYGSNRVVRRGEIDPDSRTRQSSFQLLWATADFIDSDSTAASSRRPGSALTWITVTEQGIRQSFDFTRVMFSRGNISEKIRFGQELVQPNEIVLDMYAGIGYFTLPALIHGRAKHVYCCEWNEDALEALQFNLRDNGVQDLATVLAGDSRLVVDETPLHGMVDRVSLGLLPSSEGGWKAAVSALKRKTGGWLHIHGNVPIHEVQAWARWLCSRLRDMVVAQSDHDGTADMADWIVAVVHVEKVKSFAPNVNHYVADVFLGPHSCLLSFNHATLKCPSWSEALVEPGSAVVVTKESQLEVFPRNVAVDPPSCALSEDGILHQAWMRN